MRVRVYMWGQFCLCSFYTEPRYPILFCVRREVRPFVVWILCSLPLPHRSTIDTTSPQRERKLVVRSTFCGAQLPNKSSSLTGSLSRFGTTFMCCIAVRPTVWFLLMEHVVSVVSRIVQLTTQGNLLYPYEERPLRCQRKFECDSVTLVEYFQANINRLPDEIF